MEYIRQRTQFDDSTTIYCCEFLAAALLQYFLFLSQAKRHRNQHYRLYDKAGLLISRLSPNHGGNTLYEHRLYLIHKTLLNSIEWRMALSYTKYAKTASVAVRLALSGASK